MEEENSVALTQNILMSISQGHSNDDDYDRSLMMMDKEGVVNIVFHP